MFWNWSLEIGIAVTFQYRCAEEMKRKWFGQETAREISV
jgi:hypothetical protein